MEGAGGLLVFGVHKFEIRAISSQRRQNLPNFRNHKTEKRRRKKPLVGRKLFSDVATWAPFFPPQIN